MRYQKCLLENERNVKDVRGLNLVGGLIASLFLMCSTGTNNATRRRLSRHSWKASNQKTWVRNLKLGHWNPEYQCHLCVNPEFTTRGPKYASSCKIICSCFFFINVFDFHLLFFFVLSICVYFFSLHFSFCFRFFFAFNLLFFMCFFCFVFTRISVCFPFVVVLVCFFFECFNVQSFLVLLRRLLFFCDKVDERVRSVQRRSSRATPPTFSSERSFRVCTSWTRSYVSSGQLASMSLSTRFGPCWTRWF